MVRMVMSYAEALRIIEDGNPEEIARMSSVLGGAFPEAVGAALKAAAAKTAEARKLVDAFIAHCKTGNVGAMRVALNQLRQAEMQGGFIRHMGGVGPRDQFLIAAQKSLDLAVQARAIRDRAKATKKRRRLHGVA